MGNYSSEFKDYRGNTVSDVSHPSKGNWITAHATATGLAVVEVERLWVRFKQLGSNDDGELEASITQQPPASDDIFIKNILITFRSTDGSISFQAYCNAMKWAETSNMETKMKAIFNMLNNGQPVTKDNLVRVLKRVYPNDSAQDLNNAADAFIQQMDVSHSGQITQAQWVDWAKNMPANQISALLEFNIIPTEINMEAHRAFTSEAYSQQMSLLGRKSISDEVVKDSSLTGVAKKVQRHDWVLLANKLDFVASDVAQFEARYPNDKYQQIHQMLRSWKQRERSNATIGELEAALKECGMNDAALVVRQ